MVIYFFKLSLKFPGCLFRISFNFDCHKSKFVLNEKKSSLFHNHTSDPSTKAKVKEAEILKFIELEVQKKDNKPSDIKEKLQIKFGFEINYSYSANILYKTKINQFGNPSRDADSLKNLCIEAQKVFPEFFFQWREEENKLTALFFSTPLMREQYRSYKNILILDTTFGTNRFNLPLMFGIMVNNMGRSIIAFWALTSSETGEGLIGYSKVLRNAFQIHLATL